MIRDITVPEISENVQTGDVSKVLVAVGDVVRADQPVVELETEKAVVEVPSPYDGKVTEVLVKPGATVHIGDVIVRLDDEAAEGATKAEPVKAEPAKEEPPAEKTPAPTQSKPEPQVKPEPAPSTPSTVSTQSTPSTVSEEPAPAAPSVRRLARELGVDIDRVTGSGPHGRISIEDVKGYAKGIITQTSPGERRLQSPMYRPLPDFSKWGEVERRPMSKVRRITAEGLSYSWTTIPHVTQHDQTDITELEKFRKAHLKEVEAAGGKLTFTAIMVKIAAEGLKRFPQFNTSLDSESEEIIYKKYYNIGVAVDTDRGLLVPVIRDVDRKSLTEIAVEMSQIAQATRDRKISPEQLEGGNFTISNLGGIGGTHFTPIVYPPQVAIIGVSKSEILPIYQDGQFVPRLILPLSLSYDHRVIDGADGARFMRWFAQALEHPLSLFL